MDSEFTSIDKDVSEGWVEIFTVEEYQNLLNSGALTFFDGTGYWCPSNHKRSGVSTKFVAPEWSTHVAWYSK